MFRKSYKKYILIVFFLLLSNIYAKESLNFKGFVQTWFSYNSQGSGFNIRRVMLKSYGKINSNTSWYAQYGWNQQNPALMDAAIKYSYSDNLKIKAGRFTVPGTLFGGLTPSSKLTFVERAMIVKKWNGFNGYTGFRSVGLQIGGKFNNLNYKAMVSNNQADALYTPGITRKKYKNSDPLRFIGRLAYGRKYTRAGIFVNRSIEVNPSEYSYGADLVVNKKPMKLRSGYIRGKREQNSSQITYSGLISEISWKMNNSVQPTFRYDLYDPEKNNNDYSEVDLYHNFGLGLNYYLTNNIKVQANYLIRKEDRLDSSVQSNFDNNLVYFNLQYKFKN